VPNIRTLLLPCPAARPRASPAARAPPPLPPPPPPPGGTAGAGCSRARAMVWGAGPRGLDDIVQRLHANDPKLASLTIMRFRRLDEQVRVCAHQRAAPAPLPTSAPFPRAAGRAGVAGAAATRACAGVLRRAQRAPPAAADRGAPPPSALPLRPHPLPHPRPQDVAGLCDALRTNTALTELSCSCHPVPPPAAARFGAALAANGALRSVSIGDSSLGDAGLAAMAGGLAANTGLTHLDCEHKVGGWRGWRGGGEEEGEAERAGWGAAQGLRRSDARCISCAGRSCQARRGRLGCSRAAARGASRHRCCLQRREHALQQSSPAAPLSELPFRAATCRTPSMPPRRQGVTAAGAQALARCLEAHPTLASLTLSRNVLGAAGGCSGGPAWLPRSAGSAAGRSHSPPRLGAHEGQGRA
jgi:hypothetical protein